MGIHPQTQLLTQALKPQPEAQKPRHPPRVSIASAICRPRAPPPSARAAQNIKVRAHAAMPRSLARGFCLRLCEGDMREDVTPPLQSRLGAPIDLEARNTEFRAPDFRFFDAHGHRVNVVFKQIDSLALYPSQVADANGVLRPRPGGSRTRSRKKYRSTCSNLRGARWPTRGGRDVSDLVRSRASGMETSGLGL